VQDTTELAWTAHPATMGLGPLAYPTHQGLLVHTTRALTPERLPLGLLAQQVWARDPATIGPRTTRKRRPIVAKESQKWLNRVEAVSAAHACCPQTQFVCSGDREADVYDLCLQERPSGVELLVRAAWNRRVDHPERYLWTKVTAQPMVATLTVRGPRPGPQPAHQATVAVLWCLVLLGPPTHRTAEKPPRMAVWATSRRSARTRLAAHCVGRLTVRGACPLHASSRSWYVLQTRSGRMHPIPSPHAPHGTRVRRTDRREAGGSSVRAASTWRCRGRGAWSHSAPVMRAGASLHTPARSARALRPGLRARRWWSSRVRYGGSTGGRSWSRAGPASTRWIRRLLTVTGCPTSFLAVPGQRWVNALAVNNLLGLLRRFARRDDTSIPSLGINGPAWP
jgi:hypothetical protein